MRVKTAVRTFLVVGGGGGNGNYGVEGDEPDVLLLGIRYVFECKVSIFHFALKITAKTVTCKTLQSHPRMHPWHA